MMVAVLGLGTDLELRIVNGLKTLSLMFGNIVAGADLRRRRRPRWDVARRSRRRLARRRLRRRPGRAQAARRVFRWAVVAAGVVAALLLF